jgi:hypothetical protein
MIVDDRNCGVIILDRDTSGRRGFDNIIHFSIYVSKSINPNREVIGLHYVLKPYRLNISISIQIRPSMTKAMNSSRNAPDKDLQLWKKYRLATIHTNPRTQPQKTKSTSDHLLLGPARFKIRLEIFIDVRGHTAPKVAALEEGHQIIFNSSNLMFELFEIKMAFEIRAPSVIWRYQFGASANWHS